MGKIDLYNNFSIVIPVYNQKERIKKILNELQKQCSSFKNHEIIVVDNGSTDDTIEVLKSFSHIRVLYEHTLNNSPYSARNKGIRYSKYDTIILLDATCIPANNWLINGLELIENSNASIIAGNVKFEINNNSTYSEIYDSLIHVNIKKMVNRGTAPTGNLFVRRSVFDNIGLFPDGIRSSGDVYWSKKASDNGYKIIYGKNVNVYYPPKKFIGVTKKRFRIGVGHAVVKKPIRKYSLILKLTIKLLKPISIKSIRGKIEERGEDWMFNKVIGMWFVSQVINRAFTVGKIYGGTKNILKRFFK